MKRFVVKLGIFISPFLMPFVVLSWYIGLLLNFEQVAELQLAEDNILYSVTVVQSGFYKQHVITRRQPDVIIFGSSRVLSFRDSFCNRQPAAFYNAGLRTLDIASMDYYGRLYIDSASPDVLILGIDQPYFNIAYQRSWPDIIEYDSSQINYSLSQLKGLTLLLPELDFTELSRFIDSRDPIFDDIALGTSAILKGIGHRNDGSFQFGRAEVAANNLGSLNTPAWALASGSDVNEESLMHLDNLLQYADANGVYVIGFFPPYSPSTYENNFAATPEEYTYIPQALERIETLFDAYEFSFYDFTNPVPLGLSDEIMLDEWHMSERSSLMLYLELMAREPDAFSSCSDAVYLQNLLDISEHPFQLFRP